MKKSCDLCGNQFSCLGDTDNCWCKNISINSKISKKFSVIGGDCFCESCLNFLKISFSHESNQEKKIDTERGCFKIFLETKDDEYIISIFEEGQRNYLLLEKLQNFNEAIKQYYQYCIKLQRNEFKIIKNYEALDEHYRRVYSRIRNGILFD